VIDFILQETSVHWTQRTHFISIVSLLFYECLPSYPHLSYQL